MNNLLVVLSAFLFIKVASSTTPEHAENRLSELRDLMNKKIDEAIFQQNKLSQELDEVALSTKQLALEDIEKKTNRHQHDLKADRSLTYKCRGSREHTLQHLKHLHSQDLVRCIDQRNREGVSALSTQRLSLVAQAQNAIYDEEKHIVTCIKNVPCLDAAIANVKDKVYEVAKEINGQIGISRSIKEDYVKAIRGCASRGVANAEQALGNVPTCTF